jgi:hypothetical protein
MKTKPLTETYYAVQIGKEPKSPPYFMLGADLSTPRLFVSRKLATPHTIQRISKIVKVAVTVIR